jgi:hypothetical protein
MYNNYPIYGNNQMYMQDLQNMRDRIDMQMRQMQQTQSSNQVQQTPAINQTFQLSNPQQNANDFDGKYTNNIDEVKNTLTLKNTLFVNKEMNTLWLKDAAGNIKTYSLTEVIELDEKDKMIIDLQRQIEDLKGVVLNAKSDVKYDDANVAKQKSTNVSNDKSSKK